MAGENPEDPRSGQPDEFLSKTQVAALPDPHHGPGDEPGAGGDRARRRADAGRDGACLHQPARSGRCGAAGFAGREGRASARRHHHQARFRRRRDLGTARDGRGLASRARSGDGGHPRPAGTAADDSPRPHRTAHARQRTIRDRHDWRVARRQSQHSRAAVAGEPAEKAGFKPGDVIVSIDGERMVFASQVSEAIAKHPEQEIEVLVRRDGAGAGDRGRALAAGRQRPHRHQHQRRSGVVHALAAAGRRHERATQLRDVRDDPAHPWRPVHRRSLAASADGPGRHRAALRRIGAGRLGRALQPDGVAQPQPGTAEPAAHPRARRRPHLHHGHRDDRPTRLQPGGEGEDALRGFRRA